MPSVFPKLERGARRLRRKSAADKRERPRLRGRPHYGSKVHPPGALLAYIMQISHFGSAHAVPRTSGYDSARNTVAKTLLTTGRPPRNSWRASITVLVTISLDDRRLLKPTHHTSMVFSNLLSGLALAFRIAGWQPAITGMMDAVILPVSDRDTSASVRAGI